MALLVVGVAMWSACGSADRTEWAAEAEAWHEDLRTSLGVEGGTVWARYLAPDFAWDLSALYAFSAAHPTVGRDAINFIATVLGPESLIVEPAIFVTVDGVVDFVFYDCAPLGNDGFSFTEKPAHMVSFMGSIDTSGAASMGHAMAIEDWRDRRPDWPQADVAEAVAAGWTRVWSGAVDEVDAVYCDDARLHDTIAGIELADRDAIAEFAATGGTWEITTVGRDAVHGVYPFVRDELGALEEVVLVVSGQDGNGCTGEMAVWLTLDDGLVVDEVRYWPIERARRCLPGDELPDGWWTDLPIPRTPATPTTTQPTEDLDTPTEPLVIGDTTITAYNGTPALNRLVAWGVDRFATAGLNPPTISSVTFSLYSDSCDTIGSGLHHAAPEGSKLTLCFDQEIACWDDSCADFIPAVRMMVRHELAHGWMHATLDDDTEQRFADHVGLEAWDDRSVAWDQRAMEHAADTIAWGLMDRELPVLRLGNPGPDHLASGLRILTGIDPLPRTDTYAPPGPPGAEPSPPTSG